MAIKEALFEVLITQISWKAQKTFTHTDFHHFDDVRQTDLACDVHNFIVNSARDKIY